MSNLNNSINIETINEEVYHIVKTGTIQPEKNLFHIAKNCTHIVMTNGTAVITINKTTQLLKKNESIYIPKNTLYLIENNLDQDINFILTEVLF